MRIKRNNSELNEFWLDEPDDIIRQRMKRGGSDERATSSKKVIRHKKPSEYNRLDHLPSYGVLHEKNHHPYNNKSKKKGPGLSVARTIVIQIPRVYSLPQAYIKTKQSLQKIDILNKLKNYKEVVFFCLIVIILIAGGAFVRPAINSTGTDSGEEGTKDVQDEIGFTPLISIKQVADSQGRDNLIYIPDKKVVRFEDDIFGKNIVVSQQSLEGTSAADDPGTLIKAAGSIGASKSFQSEKGQVFIVEVQDTTTQLGVFKYEGILVFLRSEEHISIEDWQYYINQLSTRQ